MYFVLDAQTLATTATAKGKKTSPRKRASRVGGVVLER
jgi:hypothetical protein